MLTLMYFLTKDSKEFQREISTEEKRMILFGAVFFDLANILVGYILREL